MFALSKLEWLALAVALLLCPGFSWSQAASGGRISRSEFNLVSLPSAAPQPSAAAGASTPKQE